MESLVRKHNFYPLILSLFPIISLLLYNLDKISLAAQTSIIIGSAIGIFLVYEINRRVFKNVHKADLVTTVIGLMFFTYGHLMKSLSILLIYTYGPSFDVLERFGRIQDHPDIQKNILFGWVILVVFTIFLLIKTKANLEPVSLFLNYASFTLMILMLFNICINYLSERSSLKYSSEWIKQIQNLGSEEIHCPEKPPDIYYIIPDGYARGDVLQNIYLYDNSRFLQFLTENGFTVIDKSYSNYSQTPLSIASSLNYSYLDSVISELGENSDNRAPLQEMILQNKVFAMLRFCGYKVITFSSGFEPTEIRDVDKYLSPNYKISDFQNEIINLTPLPTISRVFSLISQYQLHRDRISFTLNQLPLLGGQFSDPIFVFAHITAPHHPFVFDAVGNPVDSGKLFALSEDFKGTGVQEYMLGYIGQLSYINHKLEEIIPLIIAHKPDSTIIILQSDHGPSSQLDWDNPSETGIFERMSILNAYYLPKFRASDLSDTLTPVNSFRLILNHYFDADLPILEDHSNFSTLNEPYRTILIDDSIKP